MTPLYPAMLRLDGRLCVVVGGGAVAARKVAALLEAGARVTVVSPILNPALETLVAAGVITARRERYAGGVVTADTVLVFAATDDDAINRQIAADARASSALVNVADDPDSGDFENPAVVRRGALTLAISTGGASPALAAHLRDLLMEMLGEEYATLAEWMGERRADVGAALDSPADRAAVWRALLRSPVLDLLRRGEVDDARDLFERLLANPTEARP